MLSDVAALKSDYAITQSIQYTGISSKLSWHFPFL